MKFVEIQEGTGRVPVDTYEGHLVAGGITRTLCIWVNRDLSYRVHFYGELPDEGKQSCGSRPPDVHQEPSVKGASIRRRGDEVVSEPPLPLDPSEDAIDATLEAIDARLRACTGSTRTTVRVRAMLHGTLGKAGSIDVDAPNAEVRTCIAHAIGMARFPLFARGLLKMDRQISLGDASR